MNGSRTLELMLAVGLLVGFPTSASSKELSTPARAGRPVWLVSNGFHSAVGLRVRDAGPWLARLAPTRAGGWLVIGWGDADFYRASRVTPWLCLKATLWPGGSVLHVVPFDWPLPSALPHSDIVELRVPEEKFIALRNFLESSFQKDAQGNPRSFGRGYFPTSRFYAGQERFYLPKTCNVWTAVALKRAGVRVFVPCSFMADPLRWQVGKQGQRVSRRKRPVDAF